MLTISTSSFSSIWLPYFCSFPSHFVARLGLSSLYQWVNCHVLDTKNISPRLTFVASSSSSSLVAIFVLFFTFCCQARFEDCLCQVQWFSCSRVQVWPFVLNLVNRNHEQAITIHKMHFNCGEGRVVVHIPKPYFDCESKNLLNQATISPKS